MSAAIRCCSRGPLVVEQSGEQRPRGIEHGRGIGAEQHLLDRPENGAWDPEPAEFLGEPEAVPSPGTQCRQAGLDLVGEHYLPVLQHQLGAVGNDEAGRPLGAGQPLDLGQGGAHRVLVELGERRLPQLLLDPVHLEQGELDVPKVGQVVTH